MEGKTFSFRFNVDTHLCARKGVPNLIALADKLDVRFAFFFNMEERFPGELIFLRY